MRFYSADKSPEAARPRPGFFEDPGFPGFLDSLADGVALVQLDGRIRLANAVLERMLKVRRADLLGSDLTRHLRGAPELSTRLTDGLIRLSRTEVTGPLPSGRSVAAKLSILRAEGEPYAALLILREFPVATGDEPRSAQFRLAGDARQELPFLETPARKDISRQIQAGLAQNLPIHLQGETGTGKTELVKRLCATRQRPLVVLSCAALADQGLGGQPGWGRNGPGTTEIADGAILILEGVEDLAPNAQGRMLAALDGLGAEKGIQLVSTARSGLWGLVARGAFREDLYFRLAALSLSLPPLRQEPELLEQLRDAWLGRINRGRDRRLQLSAGFCRALATRPLPGNLRELIQSLHHAAILAQDIARPEDLPPVLDRAAAAEIQGDAPLKELVQAFELRTIEHSVAKHGSKRSAAKALGIDIATLVRKTNRSREDHPTRSNET